jgi:large subunit ribosomal protein L10e
MRGAFGKPQGTVARVDIGQVLISIRTKDTNKAVVIEALRRAKYKFPGRQKLIVSNKWGFTKLTREEYVTARQEGRLQPDGCYVKYVTALSQYFENILIPFYRYLKDKGPLSAYFRQQQQLAA